MKKFLFSILIIIFFFISVTNLKATSLVFSYGPSSITNSNGFLVSKTDNLQVYYPFTPGHNYRLDITGAVNPNTFWIGICNDKSVCNPSAGNYSNDGNFSVTFTDVDSEWFDIWGNCEGFGTCSITGAYLYDLYTEDTSSPSPTEVPTPTPTLSPTPTPTPSPTPSPSPSPSASPSPNPTPIPVAKLFFIPGMGASWNLDNFINCKNTNSSDQWTLAPYAKDVYQNFLTQIPSTGWNVIPFYYDWRKDIRDNTNVLKN